MELHEKDYVLAVWFGEKKDVGNFMMTVIKRGNEWLGETRLRYYEDNKVFGSKDRKTFYTFKPPITESEEEVLAKTKGLAEGLWVLFSDTKDFLEIKGNPEKFMFEMAMQPWSNVKVVKSKEEMEELMKTQKEGGEDIGKKSRLPKDFQRGR